MEEQTQWLGAFVGGAHRYLLCRRTDCGSPEKYFVAPASEWAFAGEGGYRGYWCPVCGNRYNPYAHDRMLVEANFCWILPDTQLPAGATLPGSVPS
eukprot:2376228-Prorocentrum_lima.AAC.1